MSPVEMSPESSASDGESSGKMMVESCMLL